MTAAVAAAATRAMKGMELARGKKLHGYLLVCFCGLSTRSVITLMIPSCPFPRFPPAFPFDRSFFVGRAGWRAAIFKWLAGLLYQRKGYQVMAIGMFADDSAILCERREEAARKRGLPPPSERCDATGGCRRDNAVGSLNDEWIRQDVAARFFRRSRSDPSRRDQRRFYMRIVNRDSQLPVCV